jgi:hypothetical protein
MSQEGLRRRLEALNRDPMPPATEGVPDPSTPGMRSGHTDIGSEGSLLERTSEGRVTDTDAGKCYRIVRRLSRSWPADPRIGDRFGAALTNALPQSDAPEQDLAPLVAAGPGKVLFMDLETCGFAGTPVFLLGVMQPANGDLLVEQLLARNYEEEPAILARFAELCRDHPVLTTFNGKAFDWPFLRDRAAIWRVELREPQAHCDLLHVARRRYRNVLPDCRLQTLELFVCKRRRVGDIPGQEIPSAYHDFVRTGDPRQMREVLHHNFLDLVTLAELVMDLLPGHPHGQP